MEGKSACHHSDFYHETSLLIMYLKTHTFLLLYKVFIWVHEHVCIFWICSIVDQTLGSSNTIFQICMLFIKSA